MVGDVFSGIYQRNEWNGVESRSGPGSGSMATRRTAAAIRLLVRGLAIGSVVDVGCGDGYWMPDLPGYVGIDVAPEALSIARGRHPGRAYVLDAGTASLPPADLVIVRDVIQHLSLADGVALLDRIRAAEPLWLLASTFAGTENRDVPTGGYAEPDLSTEPYALGPPVLLVPDGWDWVVGTQLRDPRKALGLWPLRADWP